MPKIAPYSREFRAEAVRLLRSGGRPIPQLAKELGVSEQSLRNWSRQLDVDDGRAPGLTTDDREELRRLRRQVNTLTEEREILKKAGSTGRAQGGLLRQGRRDPVAVFGFIAAKKAEHSIAMVITRSRCEARSRRDEPVPSKSRTRVPRATATAPMRPCSSHAGGRKSTVSPRAGGTNT
jgi:transposase